MTVNLASPGILISEIDKTNTIVRADGNVVVIALAAEKGEVNKVVYISKESELVEKFGKPNEYNYTEWFTILNLLSYNVIVGVIRPNDNTTNLITSNITTLGNDTNLSISSLDDYQNNSNNYLFSAKTPTQLYNGLVVSAIDHGADQILKIANPTVNNTIINVNSASGFANNDYIKIKDEYLRIVSITGSNITVTRGQLGSVQSNYVIGDAVRKWNFNENATLSNTVAVNNSSNISSSATLITLNSAIPNTYTVGSYLKIKRTPTGGSVGVTFEYVKIVNVNTSTNIVQVERGQLGSTAIGFSFALSGGETAVVIETILMDFAATVTTTLLANQFPSYAIPSFTGAVGDLVYANDKIGWVYDISQDTITVVCKESTKKFKAGETLYNTDQITVIGNILSVESYYEKQYIVPGVLWASVAPQPNTSDYVASRNGKFDEFHVAIIDGAGTITGKPNTVLEVHTYLSKAIDSLSPDGIKNYWRSVLEAKSIYIYGGIQDFTNLKNLPLDIINGSNQAPGVLNDLAVNKQFALFKTNGGSTISYTLGGGTSYNWTNVNVLNAALDSAYDLVADPELFDDVDFIIPGTITTQRVNKIIGICDSRKDCMTVISPKYADVVNSSNSTIKTNNITEFFDTLPSTSYAIFDPLYKYIFDKYNNTYRYIPGGSDVAGLCLNTAEPWLSPAGINRGVLKNASKIAYSPKNNERDSLYSHRINPIIQIPGIGTVLYGDKTALSSPSSFDRIGVRRLFLFLKKIVGNFTKRQLFEINDEDTRNSFITTVTPLLNEIKIKRGIEEFRVICDDTNNTQAQIDAYEFIGDIYIKPTKSINYIGLNFIAVNGNVTFNEVD